MKIAYLILAFKNPDQVTRLVGKLNSPGTHFFVHIDRRVNKANYGQFVNQLGHFQNVSFIKRHNSDWGRIGCIEAILEGIREIKRLELDYDYLIHLSGQDYPIKSNAVIRNVLQESYGMSFLNHVPIPYTNHTYIDDMINYWHIYLKQYHFIFPKEDMFASSFLNTVWNPIARRVKARPRLPLGYKAHYGSSYWCFTRETVEYINNFTAQHKNFVKWFAYVQFPDEFFMQTILMNSPYATKIININHRYIDFSSRKARPKILTVEDFPKFSQTNNLFARKFDTSIDKTVLELIDQVTE